MQDISKIAIAWQAVLGLKLLLPELAVQYVSDTGYTPMEEDRIIGAALDATSPADRYSKRDRTKIRDDLHQHWRAMEQYRPDRQQMVYEILHEEAYRNAMMELLEERLKRAPSPKASGL